MPKAFLIPTAAKRPVLMARPALVDALGRPLALSDSKKEELQMGQAFASVRQITEACTAIHNTCFVDPGNADWFNGLNNKLNVLKGYADSWLKGYAIDITSTIPSSIITFVPKFDAGAKVLQCIIDRNPMELSPSDAALARDVIARIVSKVDEISQNVEYYVKRDGHMNTSGKLIDWQANMLAARKDLAEGSANIQSACTDLKKQIAEYNSEIDGLNAEIEAYNKMIALGGGLVGGGATIGVIGYGMCFVFPWVGGVLLALGIGMVVGGGVTWGEMQNKINKANGKIVELTSKIKDDQKTILALNTLSAAASTCLASADSAISNLADFAVTWVTFGDSLRAILSALDEGSEAASGALLGMNLDEAREDWADTKDYAKQLLEVPGEIKVVPAGDQAA